MITDEEFDIFIAYHGTNDNNGSLEKAKEIYHLLKNDYKCFFNPITNSGGSFGETPTVVKHSKLFLLVSNSHIAVDKRGEIISLGLLQEIKAFHGLVFDGKSTSGNARVFAYDGLTAKQANALHVLFDMTEHFEETNDGIALKKLHSWIDSSLNSESKTVEDHKEYNVGIPNITPFEFSCRFFHSGANSIKNKSIDEIDNEISKISRLFKNCATKKFKNQPSSPTSSIAADLLEIISKTAGDNSSEKLIKIKGPLGSYKNRLLQYVYLKIARSNDKILSFYIDISMYEKLKENNNNFYERALKERVESDFKIITSIICQSPEKQVLIILDGVRNFSSGKNFIYSYIYSKIEKIRCKLVVSLDTDFTVNPRHLFQIHPLAPTNFSYFFRINSVMLYKKDESVEFIKDCIDIFNINTTAEVSPEQIYQRLVKLDLIRLDAYWLMNLLNMIFDNIMQDQMSISDVYSALAFMFIGDTERINSAADIAFDFEYGDLDFSNSDFFFDDRWRLIRKHRSVLDFLIAKHYTNIFNKFTVTYNKEKDLKELIFFNMILPKNVTRFVKDMLIKTEGFETKVLEIANNYYDDLSVSGKSELTFWLGRLKNEIACAEAISILKNLKVKQEKECAIKKSYSEHKKDMFLLRGISVSLIYCGEKAILSEYLNSLLTNKVANSINRGFHLEYYGDKRYNPSKGVLDFEDDTSKGESTFASICVSIENKLRLKNYKPIILLELVTLCSLIQARMEKVEVRPMKNLDLYIEKTQRYLKVILMQGVLREFTFVQQYLLWMQKELAKQNSLYDSVEVYDTYSTARDVRRTGWINRGIPNPENIVEHMYNCWLMGMLYLPEELELPNYDKHLILQMLLIHDLAEKITGDIPKPSKQNNLGFYEGRENEVMNVLFFNGTYPHFPSLHQYQRSWMLWIKGDNINSMIAKDIDSIQAVYQCFEYHLLYPNNIDLDDLANWYSEIFSLNTEVGENIADMLITKNNKFKEVIAKITEGEDF